MAMNGLFARKRWRAAVGLIAAYAIALQTLFAAFAPLPANSTGADFGQLSVICFGSGSSGIGDPAAPAQKPSGTFHCVLCGSAVADAAVFPDSVGAPLPPAQFSAGYFLASIETLIAPVPVRAGPARAPPPTA